MHLLLREFHHGIRHEGRVRHDDLAAVLRAKLGRPERDLPHLAGVRTDLDRVADPERPLDEHPDTGEEVLQDVLQREADHDANDAERREDPAERALGVDGEHTQDPDREDQHLREVAQQDRRVRVRAMPRERAHGRRPHRARDHERDDHDDERPERPDRVVESGIAEGGGVERHGPRE